MRPNYSDIIILQLLTPFTTSGFILMLKSVESVFRTNRIFLFLVIFRWASLIPALLTLAQNDNPSVLSPLAVSIIAIFVNAVISIFNRNLNQLVVDHPYTMSIDLLFSAFILTVSGGSHSPYYLMLSVHYWREHSSFKRAARFLHPLPLHHFIYSAIIFIPYKHQTTSY